MTYSQLFIWALTVTVTIESVVTSALKFFFGKWFKIKAGYPELIVVTILASCLTLPYVWFFLPEIIKDRRIFTVVAELFAWLVESLFYCITLKIPVHKALLFSFCANAASFILGLFLF